MFSSENTISCPCPFLLRAGVAFSLRKNYVKESPLLGEKDLNRPCQRTKASQVILCQPTGESGQDPKCSTCNARWNRYATTTRRYASNLLEDRCRDILVDDRNIKWPARLNKERAWIPSEVEHGTCRGWWLEAHWRHWRGEVELWQDDKRKLFRARDDEHLRKIVGPYCR